MGTLAAAHLALRAPRVTERAILIGNRASTVQAVERMPTGTPAFGAGAEDLKSVPIVPGRA